MIVTVIILRYRKFFILKLANHINIDTKTTSSRLNKSNRIKKILYEYHVTKLGYLFVFFDCVTLKIDYNTHKKKALYK